jgi:hypothetical protein
LADLARTWLISMMWLGEYEEQKAPEQLQLMWQRFWGTYFRRYGELRPVNPEEFLHLYPSARSQSPLPSYLLAT